jgi:hypothetical protein
MIMGGRKKEDLHFPRAASSREYFSFPFCFQTRNDDGRREGRGSACTLRPGGEEKEERGRERWRERRL